MTTNREQIQRILADIFPNNIYGCDATEDGYGKFTVQISDQWRLQVEITKSELESGWQKLAAEIFIIGFASGLRASPPLSFHETFDDDILRILKEYFTDIHQRLRGILPRELPVSVLY